MAQKTAARNWDGKTISLIDSEEFEVRVWLLTEVGLNLKGILVKIFKVTANRIMFHMHDYSATYSLPLSNLIFQVRPISKRDDEE